MTDVSIINLIPKYDYETNKDAIDRAVELAKFADKRDFKRYWVAEHHNAPGIICSATEIILAQIFHATERIRVGAGGVMLPNHTVYQTAEIYGTFEALYPGRVDLGVGRAPGTDVETAKLIYRDTYKPDNFKEAIKQLLFYFEDEAAELNVAPYPGVGAKIPVTILGSSMVSAKIAAELGLPYSFAAHFSPGTVEEAFKYYRKHFVPSKYLEKPYTILGLSSNIADKPDEAEEMEIYARMAFLELVNKHHVKGLFDVDPDSDPFLTSMEKFAIRTLSGLNISGDKSSATKIWLDLKKRLNPDEVIAVCYTPDYDKILRSYELLYDIVKNA